MAFETPKKKQEYPPSVFCAKYEKFLAPHGILLPPKQVLKNKKLGDGAEVTLKKAFKITLTKLKKMRNTCAECGQIPETPRVCSACTVAVYCSDTCREPRKISHAMVCDLLKQELIDQVIECLPSPLSMGKEVLQNKGGYVKSWRDWFDNLTSLSSNIRSAASVVTQWWAYTELKYPGAAAIQAALERMVTNVFSTVLTIAVAPIWIQDSTLLSAPENTDDKLKSANFYKKKNVHIHLIGADKPEVSAVESGLVQVIAKVVQGCCVHLNLIAPDLMHHPQTMNWSPMNPLKVSQQVSVGFYPGLYHHFWAEYFDDEDNKNKMGKPDVAIAIHPGCHTKEMWALWKPTLQLLQQKKVPVVMTTYNRAEHIQTLRVLQEIRPSILFEGINPLSSLQFKQTPYEPNHVWALNSYVIVMDNK